MFRLHLTLVRKKERGAQHSETRICRDKARDMSVFCDVQFKLKTIQMLRFLFLMLIYFQS